MRRKNTSSHCTLVQNYEEKNNLWVGFGGVGFGGVGFGGVGLGERAGG